LPAAERACVGRARIYPPSENKRPSPSDGAIAAYHTGYAIAVYLAICAVISLISTALMPDYTGKDVSAEYDSPA
jgi:hypothetical protein